MYEICLVLTKGVCKTYTNFSNNVFQNLNTNLTIILKMASRTVN